MRFRTGRILKLFPYQRKGILGIVTTGRVSVCWRLFGCILQDKLQLIAEKVLPENVAFIRGEIVLI